MLVMISSSAIDFLKVPLTSAVKLSAVNVFVTAVLSQVTCPQDVAIEPFVKNVEDVTTHCCRALNRDLQKLVHILSPNHKKHSKPLTGKNHPELHCHLQNPQVHT